ncbi:MAG: 4Fe-4S binding protein, partial [Clostridia bacterium]|nr:4Fe-4S binding protein [Clostridia bacterium]
ADAADAAVEDKEITGRPEIVDFVKKVVEPVSKMLGDTLPVSAFEDSADGTFPQGGAAFEKRGVAVDVPVWNAETCAKCNRCAFVCPHATIRPFAMNEEEVANAPEALKKAPKPVVKTNYVYTLAISPNDCMGCGVCVGVCPTKSLAMAGRESQLDQQKVFDYCVANVTKKPETVASMNLISSQYEQPLLEFSGSCAGCAETSYARLITQLFGERMYISNATGCSSIWGGSAPAMPYTVNRDSGRGPAWGNSLFEDNAEHGLGIYLGQKTIRQRLIGYVKELADICENEEKLAVINEYLNTLDDGKKNEAATKALVEMLENCNGEKCAALREKILADKQYLSKKAVWIFGGDGWAYDIGFGGLDHVLASGEDINVMVFDTEVYSNTGGQASKASNIGQVAQFAAAGKAIGKKNLAEIAMSYGYVYVAQVAMGADMNQTLKALQEAEAYHGPSIVIGYAPCEMHGLKGGMVNCQAEMKKAVEAGYWQTFRYNPALKAEGKNPLTVDCKEPTADY